MKRCICVLLAALLLLSASACAEGAADAAPSVMTQQEIRAQLGVWSGAAYEGAFFDSIMEDDDIPYVVREHVSAVNGRMTTELDWSQADGCMRSVVMERWLEPRGVITERMMDLDGDGADEWLAVTAEDYGEDEYTPADAAILWMNVYEPSGGGFILADRACISQTIDWIGDGYKLFLCEYEGRPALFCDGVIAVDMQEFDAWIMLYDGARILQAAGVRASASVEDNYYLSILGESDPGDGPYRTETSGESERFYHLHSRKDFAAEKKNAARELGVKYDPDEANGLFLPKDDRDLLLSINVRAEDADGNPVIRIERSVPGACVLTEGMVNLRSEPSLNGSIVGDAKEGVYLEYLGEQSIDDRGVAWYRVKHGGLEAWVSSRFTSLQ